MHVRLVTEASGGGRLSQPHDAVLDSAMGETRTHDLWITGQTRVVSLYGT